MLDELYEEKVVADLAGEEGKLNSKSPLRLVRSKFTLDELKSIVGRSDYFKVDDTSVKRLLYLVDNGVLFDDKDKIIINVGAYKDGKVKKSEIMKFLNEIFEFEYFRTIPAFSPMEDVVKPSPFVDFLNFTFEIKKLDGKVQTIHVNDLNRWIESAVRVERT